MYLGSIYNRRNSFNLSKLLIKTSKAKGCLSDESNGLIVKKYVDAIEINEKVYAAHRLLS